MATYSFKNSFTKGVNIDLDETRLPPDAVQFIKNLTNNTGLNENAPALDGQNSFVQKPIEGTSLIATTLPSGTNYCVGFYSSEQTNEGYFFLYNTIPANNSIWVISGDTGVATKVYQGALLQFQLDPQYFISEGRCTLELRSIIDPVTLKETNYKFLIFAFNYTNQFLIEVTSSIATNSFTTSYFTNACSPPISFYDRLELIHLGVPTPLGLLAPLHSIGLNAPTAYAPTPADTTIQNLLVRNGWQFRVKFIDIFGRESEHGIISETYITISGGDCIASSNAQPRCLILNFDAGNPLVNQIQIEFAQWVGNDVTGAVESTWAIYEVINKYDNSGSVEWYNRGYNPLFTTSGSGVTFDVCTNTIAYTFCADKNNIPVSGTETSRTEPELPRISAGVFSINKRIGLPNNVRGFSPISPAEINKVVFSAQLPASVSCNAAPTRTIVIYAAITGVESDTGIPGGGGGGSGRGRVWMSGGALPAGRVVWGNNAGTCPSGDQIFGDQTNPGFIGYLAGTGYRCVSSQGDLDSSTGVFTPKGYGTIGFTNAVQQFVFTDIPAGKYLMRVGSHKATVNDSDLPATSTYVAGQCEISDLSDVIGILDYGNNPIKEIEIDCTTSNVTLNQPTDPCLVIFDLQMVGSFRAIDGYLNEQNSQNTPIEMNPIATTAFSGGSPVPHYCSFFTDHNGFYWATTQATTSLNLYVFADICDGGGVIQRTIYGPSDTSYTVFTQTAGNGILHGDGTFPPGISPQCSGVIGYWQNSVYLFPSSGTFPQAARRTINQSFNLCSDASFGVPGIPIVLTKCGFTRTNNAGASSLIAHNRYNYQTSIGAYPLPYIGTEVPDYSGSPLNKDSLIFSQNGACEWVACGGCNSFMADVVVAYLACGAGPSGCSPLGLIETIVKNAGGSGYAANDTFTVNGGSILATGKVIAVSGGVVTAILLLTAGTGYSIASGIATTHTSGSGTGLTVNITAILPAARTTCLSALSVNIIGANIRGVQSGGKYQCAFWLHDVIGRHTAPQIREGALGFVNIPNLNDNNAPFPAMALCSIKCVIDPSTVFPVEFTKMTVLVGQNDFFSNFFSWAADWVQPIDFTGATSLVPTAIRIYYNSLNEYAKQNNFGTNTGWELITTGGETKFAPIEGDIVQFIVNGDGTYFPAVISAEITYSSFGSFFTIDYQSELAGLQNGALFKVIRPTTNTSGQNKLLYEQAITIDIINGVPQTLNFIVPYTDSYLLPRQIPVPWLKGQTGPIPPGTNPPSPGVQYTSSNQNPTLDAAGYSQNNAANQNNVVIFSLTDAPTAFPFLFESPSPSDFWGSHVRDGGRSGFPNPFEMQQRIGTEVALSDALGDRGTFNGLSYFESANVQVFDRNTFGDITAVLVEEGVCLVICNNDFFVTRYNQTQLEINAAGQVSAQNPGGTIFTEPQMKVGSNYGVIPANINTIKKHQGVVYFLDAKGRLVRIINFGEGVDVSKTDAEKGITGGYSGYIMNKISAVNIRNSFPSIDGLTYFVGGIDPRTKEYYLTSFNFPHSGVPLYINTQTAPNLSVPETLVIDLMSGQLKGFASFTPEMYGMIPGFITGKNFFSFKQGHPWKHHAGVASPALFANFYGTQCEVRITLVVNGVDGKTLPDKVKRFLYNEVYCRQSIPGGSGVMPSALLFADVINSEKGQTSRLLVGRWVQRDGLWCAEYLCDLTTPPDPNNEPATTTHAILDGDPLQGRWAQVSLTSNVAWAGTYFEITSIVNYLNLLEKSAD